MALAMHYCQILFFSVEICLSIGFEIGLHLPHSVKVLFLAFAAFVLYCWNLFMVSHLTGLNFHLFMSTSPVHFFDAWHIRWRKSLVFCMPDVFINFVQRFIVIAIFSSMPLFAPLLFLHYTCILLQDAYM